MIEIIDKKDCVGCEACVQRCPKSCISFNRDEQGFSYPRVDLVKCIHCNLCEKVCPVLNQYESRIPQKIYAAKNKNIKIQKQSSSGGAFSSLSAQIIEAGGVVFGARFDKDWLVIHDYTESLDGLELFRGSKYPQSRIGHAYEDVEKFLKKGRKVLFTGTPCQIAGLKRFLNKDYGKLLLTIDVVCHGVPGPLIWQDYLISKTRTLGYSLSDISSINFRDKRRGWSNYGMEIKYDNKPFQENFETLKNNEYMQGFLRDLYLRPSCYACPAKSGKSNSDVTLGDFWKIQNLKKEDYDDNGISLVLVNSDTGMKILNEANLTMSESTYETAIVSNSSIIDSAKFSKYYSVFWNNYKDLGITALGMTIKKARGPIWKRALRYFYKKIISFVK